MTFKELRKRVTLETSRQQSRLFEKLLNKPFWIWDKQQHKLKDIKTNGNCCFNHIIGPPQKDGNDKPLYDYQQIIFDSLVTQNSNKHLWIKKATGKGLITFDTKETVIELNGVKIEAFPSHHLDAMRGLSNVSFILLDEADFFPPGQQQDARACLLTATHCLDVSERYIAKSNPYIVMVSTPNAPEGLFERIEKESEDTCLYKRIFLDYTYGIGEIYTADEIEQAKRSPSFEREYNLKYLGRIGNVFHHQDIIKAVEMGNRYDPDPDKFNPYSHFTSVSMGIDPGYGSSAFGIVVTKWADDHIQILHAEEYHRPDYNEMLSTVY